MRALLWLSVSVFFSSIFLPLIIKQSENRPTDSAFEFGYVQDYGQFLQASEQFVLACEKFYYKKNTTSDVRSEFLKLKLAYKRIEYVTSFFDRTYDSTYFNGRLEPNIYERDQALLNGDYQGLQAIDALLFSGAPEKNTTKILELARAFDGAAKRYADHHRARKLDGSMVWEAMRVKLIALYTLDINSYDSPRSKNSILEAASTLEGLLQAVQFYERAIIKANGSLIAPLNKSLSGAIKYLQLNPDFNNFDRAAFYQLHFSALYGHFVRTQFALRYQNTPAVSKSRKGLAFGPDQLFSSSIIEQRYFTDVDPRQEVVELGRMLFFDPVLSGSNQMACATCHIPKYGFASEFPTHRISDLHFPEQRNIIGLTQSALSPTLFWDGRFKQGKGYLRHSFLADMKVRVDSLNPILKVAGVPIYLKQFARLFPDTSRHPVSEKNIEKALSAYLSSLAKFDSPFDKYMRGELPTYNPVAIKGYNLFMGKGQCSHCHYAPTFSGLTPPFYGQHRSGSLGVLSLDKLGSLQLDADPGVDPRPTSNKYRHFKVPTLRNVMLTKPYFHNGVSNTIENSIDFHLRGGAKGAGIENPNQSLSVIQPQLTNDEKLSIITFLETLTDTNQIGQRPKSLPPYEKWPSLNNRKVGGGLY